MESRKDGTDGPICRAGIETEMWRKGLWSQWGKERTGRVESSTDMCTPHV